jgi:hypothetical protein
LAGALGIHYNDILGSDFDRDEGGDAELEFFDPTDYSGLAGIV